MKSDRYAPFRGWLAHVERLNNAGPLDTSDMQARARQKREAGESLSAWIALQQKILRLDDYRDHDREVERDNPERNA